jgi:branched-chain amino acid transport system substrate-binding protein
MMIIVMLIVGLGIGGGIGYFMAPVKEIPGETIEVTVEVEPLDGQTIRFGQITSDTPYVEDNVVLTNQMMTPSMNDFLENLGYDIKVEILNDNAEGQAAVHLEKVQGFKAMDVNLVIGGRWSSQAQGALSYVNENNMLLYSPSSTSPLLSIADDNLYRMCPDDFVQSPAISEMLWNWGIKAIIVIMRADPWADGIYNLLAPDFESKGGVVLEKIRYAAEVTEFSSYLATAESIAADAVAMYGAEHVAIEVISFREAAVMATQAKDFPTLWSLKWFGSDGTALTEQFVDDAPTESDHLKVFSTMAAPASSHKFQSNFDEYWSYVGHAFDYYDACTVDCGWTTLEAVLESQSVDASDVIPLLQTITYNHFGVSGWTRLNENGDRHASNYLIWGYTLVDDECHDTMYGVYDGTTQAVTWYPNGITSTGVSVPGVVPPGQ